MRSDLAKLTTEAPRSGSSYAEPKKYGGRVRIVHDPEHLYDDEVGGFHSSARRRQWNHKDLTDKLNPIKGVLRKNVGRLWDDVYSEFSQFLDKRSVNGIHIFGHMLDEVERTCFFDDTGVLRHHPHRFYGYWKAEAPEMKDGFYVHPTTHTLEFMGQYGGIHWKRYRNTKYPPKPIEKVDISENEFYELREVGRSPRKRFKTWFRVSIKSWTETYWYDVHKDTYQAYHRLGRATKTTIDDLGNENYFIQKTTTKTSSTHRSASRKDMKVIRAHVEKKIQERLDTRHNSG